MFGLENRRKRGQIINDDIHLPADLLLTLCTPQPRHRPSAPPPTTGHKNFDYFIGDGDGDGMTDKREVSGTAVRAASILLSMSDYGIITLNNRRTVYAFNSCDVIWKLVL